MNLRQVNKWMDADTREIVGRVEITYSDVQVDPTLQAEATATGRFTYPSQVFDQKEDTQYKWFALFNNKLDGTFRLLPSTPSYQVGWWDTCLSDENGLIADPGILSVSFAARHIVNIQVVGDAFNKVIPVDFTFALYNENDELQYEETVIGNTKAVWSTALTETYTGITKAILYVTRINQPFQVARVLEFFITITEVYENDDIQSINLNEEVEYLSSTGALGTVTANEISIILNNTSGKFSRFDTSSPLYNFLRRNRRIKAWLGVVHRPTLTWGALKTTTWGTLKEGTIDEIHY